MQKHTCGLILAVIVAPPMPLSAEATISIRPDRVLNKIPPFGYNMIAANGGFGITKENGEFDSRMVESLKTMGLPLLRFPGGTYANRYEWKRAIGPLESRGGMHGWKHIPDDNRFGPDEAAKLVELTGGENVFVVNLNMGARYAADWVEYMNCDVGENPNGGIDWAAVRASNGRTKPYHVKYWEIGNEAGNGLIWQSWPRKGMDRKSDQLPFSSSEIQKLVTHGGIAGFSEQKAVRLNAWDDKYIRSMGIQNERYHVLFFPVQKESFVLKVGADYGTAETWKMVQDFSESGPGDQVYTLDETTGEISFGDGSRGSVLPKGDYVWLDYMTQKLDGHVQIYNAMKEADPSIVIGDAFYFLRLQKKDDPAVAYDGIQEHMALETMSKFKTAYPGNVFKNVIALSAGSAASHMDHVVRQYEELMGHAPNLFLSEYSIFHKTVDGTTDHKLTVLSALYFALFNAAIAERGEHIQLACMNYLANHGGKEGAFFEGNPVPNAHAVLTRLYSQFFGNQRIDVTTKEIPTMVYDYYPLPWSKETQSKAVPKLYALASIDAENRKYYLLVINTTADEAISAKVTGDGEAFSMQHYHEAVTLRAVSLTAVNSKANPENIRLVRESRPDIKDNSFNWIFDPATVTSFVWNW